MRALAVTQGEARFDLGGPEDAKQEEPKAGGASVGGSAATAASAQVLAPTVLVPVVGVSEAVSPVSGRVLVRLKGSSRFVALSAASLIPVGSEVEATNGRVIIT